MRLPPLEHPNMNALLQKKIEARDWAAVTYLWNSWNRLDAFVTYVPMMTKTERAETLAEIWTSCDGVWDWRDLVLGIFQEAGYSGDLPRPTEPLTLYRSVSVPRHRLGLSWTTSLKVAREFVAKSRVARSHRAYVYRAVAPPAAILAGFGERDEAEYVVDPSLLEGLKLVESFDWTMTG